jgi:hypothetical protein
MSRISGILLAGFVCASLAGWSGCSRKPTDPVLLLMAELEEAAEDRDADRFAKGISDEFLEEGGLDKPNAVLLLRRYFAAYEAISIDVYGVEIERGEGEAEVRCIVEMKGRARKLPGLERLLPPDEAYRFDVGMVDEAGIWRVRTARWKSTEPPIEMP